METVIALRAFHSGERHLFERLLNLGKDSYQAKKIMALWLWLESVGFHDLLQKIRNNPDRILLMLVTEAEASLACIENYIRPTSDNDIPLTSSLVEEGIALRFFDFHRQYAVMGITHFLNGVCVSVFDDIIVQRALRNASEVMVGRPFGEGSSRATFPQGLDMQLGLAGLQMVQPTSNPNPFLWSASLEPLPEDERSLFVTFSRGYPLSRGEIINFFTENWGNCIDNVMIERPLSGDPPRFCRVVFKSTSVIPLILDGQQKAKFVVNGKHLWARMFVPKN